VDVIKDDILVASGLINYGLEKEGRRCLTSWSDFYCTYICNRSIHLLDTLKGGVGSNGNSTNV